MQTVYIYIETDKRGTSKTDAKFLVILQLITASGMKAEKIYGDILQNQTENSIYLEALISALEHLLKPSNLHIHIDNKYFRNTYMNGWPQIWKKNGWQKANGTTPAHAAEWSNILSLLEDHNVVVDPEGEHEFSKWMKCELQMREEDYEQKYTSQKRRDMLSMSNTSRK